MSDGNGHKDLRGRGCLPVEGSTQREAAEADLMEVQTLRARVLKVLEGVSTESKITISLRYTGGPSELFAKLKIVRDELKNLINDLQEETVGQQ